MNAIQKNLMLTLALAAATLSAATSLADPLPGRDLLKFSQQPMDFTPVGGAIYFGHDEISTAYNTSTVVPPQPTAQYVGEFVADDFADTLSTPVVHVKWWGSYRNNFQNPNIPVNKFLIAFESDQPQGPGVPFSYPLAPLLSQVVDLGALSPASGTYTETAISPGGPPLGEVLYEYNAELAVPFPQQADTVYWLKIVALVDGDPNDAANPAPQWGWHNRDYTANNPNASTVPFPNENNQGTAANPIWHFQDDAIAGRMIANTFVNTAGVTQVGSLNQFQNTFVPLNYNANQDGPQGISNFSQDQAFELFTLQIPEPASLMLMAAGLIGVAAARRQRRAS